MSDEHRWREEDRNDRRDGWRLRYGSYRGDGVDHDRNGRHPGGYGRVDPGRGGYYERFGYGRDYGEPYRGYGREAYGRDVHHGNHDRGWWDRASDEVASWFGDEDAGRRRLHDAGLRGRGPKGYVRSDARILEDVCDRLSDDAWLDASDVEVTVEGSEVTLSGTVNSRDERRRAEDCADRVSGVTHVQNNLRVALGGNLQPPGNPGPRTIHPSRE